MPRMISNSTISNFTRYSDVTFSKIVTGKFMYTRVAIIGSPTGVESEKRSERFSRLTLNFTAIYGVSKERIAPGSNKA